MSRRPREECTKIALPSRTVAWNWATLHVWTHHGCESIQAFECQDGCEPGTWHIGHADRASGDQCKAESVWLDWRGEYRTIRSTGKRTKGETCHRMDRLEGSDG